VNVLKKSVDIEATKIKFQAGKGAGRDTAEMNGFLKELVYNGDNCKNNNPKKGYKRHFWVGFQMMGDNQLGNLYDFKNGLNKEKEFFDMELQLSLYGRF